MIYRSRILAAFPTAFLIACGAGNNSSEAFDREMARTLLSQASLSSVIQVTSNDALCLEQHGMLRNWRIVGKATSAIQTYTYVRGISRPDSITFASPLAIEVNEITGVRNANQATQDGSSAKRIEFSGTLRLAGGETKDLYEAVRPCLGSYLQIRSGVAIAEMYDDGWRVRIESGVADKLNF